MSKLELKRIGAISIAALFTTSCSQTSAPPIVSPTKWQAHLTEAKLDANFVPAENKRVYVPIYSHIYDEDTERSVPLVATLSIRNTDESERIIIKSIRYYDTEGRLLQSLVDKPFIIAPFATAEVVQPRTNVQGGSGANFVIDWMSASEISEPIIEAVMISTGSANSLSFTSRGEVIHRPAKQTTEKVPKSAK